MSGIDGERSEKGSTGRVEDERRWRETSAASGSKGVEESFLREEATVSKDLDPGKTGSGGMGGSRCWRCGRCGIRCSREQQLQSSALGREGRHSWSPAGAEGSEKADADGDGDDDDDDDVDNENR